MSKICPVCIQNVEQFTEQRSEDGATLHHLCPRCGDTVASEYATDRSARPLLVSLVGLKSHGKTVFLSSLLHELDPTGILNPGALIPTERTD